MVQQRLLRGDFAVHETCSPYKSLEDLWDGEIWNGDGFSCLPIEDAEDVIWHWILIA